MRVGGEGLAVRKALGIAAMAGLFLLLLSALVVASPQESVSARRMERDANGRVLTAPRYAQSVYQVFRAELAGG